MTEIRWKQITGTKYILSDTGLVKNQLTQKYLKPRSRKYPTVGLCTNGITKDCALHRLVAEYFVPNPENLPLVRHLDNNTKHYKADNLCWGTYSDNIEDAIRDGVNAQGVKVYQYTAKELVAIHRSLSAAAKALGLANPSNGGATHVKEACEGKLKLIHGFRLSYIKDGDANALE